MWISNVIVCGFIIHFRTIICVLTVFLLYDTMMMVTRLTETCITTYKCSYITLLYINTLMHGHWWGTVCSLFDADKHYILNRRACFVSEILQFTCSASLYSSNKGHSTSKQSMSCQETPVVYVAHAPVYRIHFIQMIHKFTDLFYSTLCTI